MKGNSKAERERRERLCEWILEETSVIEKINRQWKDGLITESQFSKTLDRLLLNIKEHKTGLKQPDPRSLEKRR